MKFSRPGDPELALTATARTDTDLTTATTLKPVDTFSTAASDVILGPLNLQSNNMPWYYSWVQQALSSTPMELISVLNIVDKKSTDYTEALAKCWAEMEHHLRAHAPLSIDAVVASLAQKNLIALESSTESLSLAKSLVFSILGWQSMLYVADQYTCPSSQLAIKDLMHGYKGQAHMSLKQNHTACKKTLHDFLLMYGVLLPPRNFNAATSTTQKSSFNEMRSASPTFFNACLLTTVGRLKIEWVDTLPCHLEFDPNTSTLFLFRFPSFCIENYTVDKIGDERRRVIHACARPSKGAGQWATEEEVNAMLFEVVISYRLLFGQQKAARKWFRKHDPFESKIPGERDEMLTELCSRKHPRIKLALPDRQSYDLPVDFPIHRGRIAVLLKHLSDKKPRTWGEIWNDKRDSAGWLTFWAVIIIGFAGIFLAFVQVILQIIQIIQS